MLTDIAKNKILLYISSNLVSSVITDNNSFTVGANVLTIASVSSQTDIGLVWAKISNTQYKTSNVADNSNAINFSIKKAKSPKRIALVSSGGIIQGYVDLPTPVPSYTNGGSYYVYYFEVKF